MYIFNINIFYTVLNSKGNNTLPDIVFYYFALKKIRVSASPSLLYLYIIKMMYVILFIYKLNLFINYEMIRRVKCLPNPKYCT